MTDDPWATVGTYLEGPYLAGPWYSPDCWAGKHEPSCTGGAWDDDADEPTACGCPCHGDYDPEDEDGPAVVDVPTGGYL